MNESPYKVMASDKVIKKLKKIGTNEILNTDKLGIDLIGTDEMFVKIEGSNTHYISNYGRVLAITDRARILWGHFSGGKTVYNIPVWVNGERVERSLGADRLVLDAFYEYDNKQRPWIWHAGNDLEDNYYKNIYPVSKKEYRSIKKFVQDGGLDTEEKIQELIDGEAYFIPSILGVGYWGTPDVDIKHWTYTRWTGMLMRCYSKAYQSKQATYIGCTVDKEWHNYANFKKWAEENFYQVNEEAMELDKDILHKGNKVYSKNNCAFVPQSINSLIINCRAVRGEFPIGIDKFEDKYRARMSYCGKQIVIGSYDTIEEAFQHYKEYKEKFIKDIAKRYKGRIPENVFEALMKWEIEYND